MSPAPSPGSRSRVTECDSAALPGPVGNNNDFARHLARVAATGGQRGLWGASSRAGR